MIRDGLAEEGFEVQVHSNPRTGWDVAIISDNENKGTQSRAETIAAELRHIDGHLSDRLRGVDEVGDAMAPRDSLS